MLALAAGRRSKFVVAGLTLLIALALGSQAGKLTGVTSNNKADSLPRGAESAAVLAAVKRLPTGATTPAVTVMRRDAGLTAADRAYLEGRRASLNADRLSYARLTPLVRSVIVPALIYDAGRKVWWPSRLADRGRADQEETLAETTPSRDMVRP